MQIAPQEVQIIWEMREQVWSKGLQAHMPASSQELTRLIRCASHQTEADSYVANLHIQTSLQARTEV